ncbi:MAG: hypothetical protein MUF49_12535 [Oculatellaceae cyanobacterium Prado106]|nr:hypothetical protein [Oculatellaceae cyanobacterium Prado106]
MMGDRRPDENAAEYTTRLLSGSAYRRGLLGAFELLGHLRSDRYKAKSPENRLDLDRIAQHAIQSVALSVWAAVLALALGFGAMVLLQGGSAFGGVAFLLNFAGALVIAYELIYLRWAIARRFLKQFYNPNFQPQLPLYSVFLESLSPFFKQQIIAAEPFQNVIVFGRYQPFLGAGGQESQWTLAIDRKPDQEQPLEGDRIDIPVEEFYRAVDQEVAILKLPQLKGLTRLFVDGFELAADGTVLPSAETAPITNLPESELWKLGQTDLQVGQRAYRLYQYTDIERDQVLSYFLRFYNMGSITFVEASVHILPNIDRKRFSLTPVLKESQVIQIIKVLGLALFLSFGLYWLIALAYLAVISWKLVAWHLEDRRQLRAAKWHEEYNYGHTQTFRESISARTYESYYGLQDLTMYWKAIEQATFSGVIKLLKRHHVDTSQFEQVANTIVNTGIMVSGGNFSANQVAAGAGAKAVQQPGQASNPMQQFKAAISNGAKN